MIRKRVKPKQKGYVSIFTKSVFAFLVIGILPMLIMGFSIYNKYSVKITESILLSSAQMASYMERNISDFVAGMDENTKYLYHYNISDYDYFYKMMLNSDISETKREALVNRVLRDILYRNEYIDHVFFVEAGGKVYTEMRIPKKKLNAEELKKYYGIYLNKSSKNYQLIPTHMAYYYNENENIDFTIARNIYNTQTVETAAGEVLGTIYIDINIRYLEELLQSIEEQTGQRIAIIHQTDGKFIFCKDREQIGKTKEEYSAYMDRLSGDSGCLEASGKYIIYNKINGTDWILLNDMSYTEIEKPYLEIRRNTILFIFVGGILLGIIYLFYATKTNKPMKGLMNAMEEIQRGNLSARAEITTNDEIAVIAAGLNNMTEKLEGHINQVYIAGIKQRDAQLEALKTQIQPHYLYNTLDVIRMSAITNHDTVTADMLDSLTGQLKYTIGTTRDMVTVQSELNSIKNYFKLIEIRFNNKYQLEIEVREEVLEYQVPKLILQPIVENALNHGLKPKQEGKIEIVVNSAGDYLEITIMDNGVGMSEAKVEEINQFINSDEPGVRNKENWESIGIKNVRDRIRLMFGQEYGLAIDSYKGIGTIVKYKLPLLMEPNHTFRE